MQDNELPISGEAYFKDFSMDIEEYKFKRTNEVLKGIPDKEYGKTHIHFPYNSNIVVGDQFHLGDESYQVSDIVIETYNGSPSLLRVHYT